MKTIKSRVEFQINKLVEEIGTANTTSSEQERSYFTSKAMYRADRIAQLLRRASIGAVVVFFMAACTGAKPDASASDSTVVADTVAVDTTHAEVQ